MSSEIPREFLSPRAREAQILWFVASQGFLRRFHRRMCKTGFARRALTGNGMRCARRGRGRFVQTTENPAGSPGAARGRVLLCKLIVKTCPQITVNGPVSAKLTLDNTRPAFYKSRCGATSPVRSTPYPRRQALPLARARDKNPTRKKCAAVQHRRSSPSFFATASVSGSSRGHRAPRRQHY
jgi:hypothetical protein